EPFTRLAISAPRDLDDAHSPNPPAHPQAATSGFITITSRALSIGMSGMRSTTQTSISSPTSVNGAAREASGIAGSADVGQGYWVSDS
ncbi:MAG TPA: hypothetical protein VJS45_02720, partial [Acidimicrobiia bacterium]|nr:hypothetical protein [Acidimicrobiia bacterium]